MFTGYFLNLQRNEQRRMALLAHLAEVGAQGRYERWEAVDGRAAAPEHPTKLDPGALGLWLTHERLLQAASRDSHVHILEDDALLARNAVAVLDGLLSKIDTMVSSWDLLFTDIFVQAQTEIFVKFWIKMREFAQTNSYAIVDLKQIPFACTTSMLINKSSIDKYLQLLAGNWRRGTPIDIYLRDLVRKGQLKAFVTIPFITSISATSAASDIRGNMDRSRRVCDTFRRGFFQDADLTALMAEMQQLVAGAKVFPLASLYLNAEMFTLSDKFESF